MAIAVACLGIAGGLDATRSRYPFWTSPPAILAGVFVVAALACLYCAIRAVRFPGVRVVAHPKGRGYGPLQAVVRRDGQFLEVGIANDGLSLNAVSINLLVPSTFSVLLRIGRDGKPSLGNCLDTSESLDGQHGSIYWAETGLVLPGRISTIYHFVANAPPGAHPYKLKIISDELPEDFVQAGTFTIPPRP